MWKRDQGVRSTGGREAAAGVTPTPAAVPQAMSPVAGAEVERRQMDKRDVANIGKLVVIRGELSGDEDLTIEGRVDGKIELKDHILTVGPNGVVQAEVFAKIVVVLGQVTGNILASEKVDIRDNGSVEGDLLAPRVAIAEGAHFRGSIDMQKKAVVVPTAVTGPAPSSDPDDVSSAESTA